MTTYTVIAYREDGVDTCRGCVMDRSSSDFALGVFQSAGEAAAWHADKLFNSPSGREYCSWEFTWLVDGLDSDSWWGVHGESDLEEPDFCGLQKLGDQKLQALMAAKAERERLAKEEADRKAALEQVRKQEEKEARERTELKRLQEKYGA